MTEEKSIERINKVLDEKYEKLMADRRAFRIEWIKRKPCDCEEVECRAWNNEVRIRQLESLKSKIEGGD